MANDRETPSRTARSRELRRSATDAENRLWFHLRGRRDGLVWRRQHPIGPYFVDFYCASARLAVELDGDQHADPVRQKAEEERTAHLASRAVKVVRFASWEMLADTDSVLEALWREVRARLEEIGASDG